MTSCETRWCVNNDRTTFLVWLCLPNIQNKRINHTELPAHFRCSLKIVLFCQANSIERSFPEPMRSSSLNKKQPTRWKAALCLFWGLSLPCDCFFATVITLIPYSCLCVDTERWWDLWFSGDQVLKIYVQKCTMIALLRTCLIFLNIYVQMNVG